MTPVTSSNLAAVGYDQTSGELHVTFKPSGLTYAYTGVTPEAYAQLMAAPSKGSHFRDHIRGHYTHRKLAPEVRHA